MKLSSKHITELETLERVKTRLHDVLIEVRQLPELFIVDEAEHAALHAMSQKWIEKVEERSHHIYEKSIVEGYFILEPEAEKLKRAA